jgi:hypothetical protein
VIGVIFGLGGGVGVLIGSASAAAFSRRFGHGRTLIVAHALFRVLGLPLALSVGLPWLGGPLAFVSEFAQLSVNAVQCGNLGRSAGRFDLVRVAVAFADAWAHGISRPRQVGMRSLVRRGPTSVS